MSGIPNDKRRYPRVQARNVSAHLNVASQSSPCTIQNISAGGLFIQTGEALPVGMPVAVNLACPGWTKVLQLTGRVVWAMAERTAAKKGTVPGMRIKFDPLPTDNARQLMVLLTDLGAFDSIPPEVSAELGNRTIRPSSPGQPIQLLNQVQMYTPPPVPNSAPQPGLAHPEMEITHPSAPVATPLEQPVVQRSPHHGPDDATIPAMGHDGARVAGWPGNPSVGVKPTPIPVQATPIPIQGTPAPVKPTPIPIKPTPIPVPVPSSPGSNRGASDSPRLIVQVQGLLMQMGELQQQLERRDREIDELRKQLAAKDAELEKAERERRAAELAVQRLSMQITTARRG